MRALFYVLLLACCGSACGDDFDFANEPDLYRTVDTQLILLFDDGSNQAYDHIEDFQQLDRFNYNENGGTFRFRRLDEDGRETVALVAFMDLPDNAFNDENFLVIDSLQFPVTIIGQLSRYDVAGNYSCSYGPGLVRIFSWERGQGLQAQYTPADTTATCAVDGRVLREMEIELSVAAVRQF